MPSLTWPDKGLAHVEPGRLHTDTIVYPGGSGYPDATPEDRLILGDNLRVMAALLPEYEGRIDLIYVDPPFFTGKRFAARIGRGEDSRKPREWALAEGYQDAWPNLDAYLDFLYPRLKIMHGLLAPTGTLYLHLDWHADAYARVLLDEIFGSEHFLNEIIWTYHGPSPIRSAFNRKHDTILAYVKSAEYTFNADAVRQPYNPTTVETFKSSRKAGFGKVPDLARGKVPEDWWYFPVVARLHNERTGYPTQKPEALIERMVLASSNPGQIVADFFCGSGTAPVVARRMGRKFIACDDAFRGVHTTRRRLCLHEGGPFTLELEEEAEVPRGRGASPAVKRDGKALALIGGPDVDFWEVDPAWNGRVFRSAAQAQRGNGDGAVAPPLQIKTGRHSCVRLVTVKGEVLEKQLHV